eukprot:EG_transcript_11213
MQTSSAVPLRASRAGRTAADLSLGKADAPAATPTARCLPPRLALVHNPYSFVAYDLVLSDAAVPLSPQSPRSSTSNPSSVGDPYDTAGRFPGRAHPHPEAPRPPSPSNAEPAEGSERSMPESTVPISPRSDLWGSASGSDHLTAPPTTAIKKEMPPLRWRRYGAAVSHVQALKDLQAYSKRHPAPPPPPPPPVWVGPPSLAAPAALPMKAPLPTRCATLPARHSPAALRGPFLHPIP